MEYEVVASLHIGNRVKNDDSIVINDRILSDNNNMIALSLDASEISLLAVADGMGGVRFGNEGSNAIVQMLAEYYVEHNIEFTEDSARELLVNANSLIIRKGIDLPRNEYLSTLSGLLIQNDELISFSAGDSPIIIVRDGYARILNTMHNVKTFNDTFGISIHSNPEALVEYMGNPNPQSKFTYHIKKHRFQRNDLYIICSDGLTNMFAHLDDLYDEIAKHQNLYLMVEALSNTALQNGGHDNISIVAIRVKE